MESYQGCKTILKTSGSVISKCVQLNTGASMPIIGYGTFRVTGKENIFNCLDTAFSAGYRLIDTASVYSNESAIGEALKSLLPKHNLSRENIFIVSKLSPSDQGAHAGQAALESLRTLGLTYIDLYLVHWPGVTAIDVTNPENSRRRIQTWKELEKVHDNGNGILKSIGVSNYTSRHIKEVLENCTICPSVNQVEFHPYYQQPSDLYNICQDKNIVLQAYSSLGGSDNQTLLKDPTINSVARNINKSSSQVLLRWALQCGYTIIPKSKTAVRILENAELDFTLSDSDYNSIKKISIKKKYAWDPTPVL